MTHVRKQIRDLAVTAVTGLTTTGANVFADRAYPIPQDKLPALRIFYSREVGQLEQGGMGTDPTMHRRASLTIVGYADGTGLDDTLDLIATEVEIAIDGAGDYGGRTVGNATYTGTDFGLEEGDSRTGFIAMTWEVQYRTAESDPETAL